MKLGIIQIIKYSALSYAFGKRSAALDEHSVATLRSQNIITVEDVPSIFIQSMLL
jgi:hypothetical protein